MTRYFLVRIKIEGFRGINNEAEPLELKFRSDAVNSLFAVNGIGKSSIFEGLSYVFRGKVPKLEELQAQEKPEEYVCNKFHSKGAAVVEIEVAPDDKTLPNVTIVVKRDTTGGRTVTSPSGHPNPEAFLRTLNQEFILLDHRTFTRFIDSSPLERGRSFSGLLGLSAYSDFRQTLKAVCETRALDSDLELTTLRAKANDAGTVAKGALRRLASSYESLIGRPISDISALDACADDVLAAISGIELIKPAISGKSLSEIDFQKVMDLIRAAEGGEQRKELADLIAKVTELNSLGASEGAVHEAEQEQIYELLREKEDLLKVTQGELFSKLYETAKTIVESGQWTESNKCLLCESELQTPLQELLQNHLDQYASIQSKAGEICSRLESSEWIRRLRDLEQTRALEVRDPEKIADLLSRCATLGELTTADVNNAAAHLQQLEAKRLTQVADAIERKHELEKEIPPSLVRLTEQIEFARQFRQALADYNNQTSIQKGLISTLRLRLRWQKFIDGASDTFSAAETELSRSRISAIDAQYKSMFARIVGVNDVVPDLERAGPKENLQVQLSDFHGQAGLSARALLSESYRNALAISVFLSAAMQQTGSSRFVVLDDVTSSFDSGNQYNLMELIRQKLQYPKNTAGLQFIILSHDGLLEKYFDKLGITPDWHHQRLQGWPPLGAVMSQFQDANRLRKTATDLLDAGQVKEAEPLIRQYLEFKLLEVIRKVNIPAPLDFAIKDHLKMVSNCLNVINSAIALHKAANTLVLDPSQVNDLDTILVPALVGNWVSHYETASGSSLAPPVLKGVLQTIDDFTECFRFDDTSSGSVQRRWYKSLG